MEATALWTGTELHVQQPAAQQIHRESFHRHRRLCLDYLEIPGPDHAGVGVDLVYYFGRGRAGGELVFDKNASGRITKT